MGVNGPAGTGMKLKGTLRHISYNILIMGQAKTEQQRLCSYTVEAPNKGHFGNNITNSAVLSLIGRLSSSRKFSMNRNYIVGSGSFWDPKQCPL